jgi:recombinational DNA repair protein RecT
MTTPNQTMDINSLVISKKQSILETAVPGIRSNIDTWSKRAITDVLQNKELSNWIMQNKENQLQFITKLSKAAQVGLQVGGIRPHVYFVNMNGQLRMDITKEGLCHASVYGEGAVLQVVPEIVRVYSKDKFTINQAGKTYTHEFDPLSDRGELKAWYTVLHYKQLVDGEPYKEIPFVTLDKVKKIRDNYSMISGPAWKKSEDEMLDKIATKQLLKKPFAESEGLAMHIQAVDTLPLDEPKEIPSITERAVSKVDQAMGNLGTSPIPTEKDVSPKQTEEDKQNTKNSKDAKGKELF